MHEWISTTYKISLGTILIHDWVGVSEVTYSNCWLLV